MFYVDTFWVLLNNVFHLFCLICGCGIGGCKGPRLCVTLNSKTETYKTEGRRCDGTVGSRHASHISSTLQDFLCEANFMLHCCGLTITCLLEVDSVTDDHLSLIVFGN